MSIFGKRKYAGSFLVILFSLLCIAGCGKEEKNMENTKGEVTTITAEKAYEMMQSGDDLTIVDVRTEEEYAEGHIEGAIVIPNETIGTEEIEELSDKDATLLIYCRSGRRSAQAAQKLVDLGYTNVYDFGGIIDWPYEVVQAE